jgi:hypothetical protein
MPFSPWLSNEYLRLGIKAALNQHLSLAVIPEIRLWNDTYDWNRMIGSGIADNPFNQHVSVSLADAEGTVSFGSNDALACNISAGVIPYKYDKEAKNLGEYLFRSGEHPAYIQTSFDQAYATLNGLRVNAVIQNNLSMDLLVTAETQIQPINDISLSFLLGYKIPGYTDFGVGISFDRLWPAVKELDQVGIGPNIFKTSTGQPDTLSWGGTKVMAHLSFDPKGFLSKEIAGIFGPEDGKIYGEAAILGVKNIAAYKDSVNPDTYESVPGHYVIDSSMNFYSDITQRIPIMFGFNIPTLKILDYLSVELEWFGWPYSRNIFNVQGFKYFLPKANGLSNASNWKYSINLKRTIWEHLSIIGQIASDHTRHDVYFFGNIDVNEIFPNRDQWGWWLKLQYNF